MYLVIIYNVYQIPHSIVTIVFCGDRILFVIWYRILFVSINLLILLIIFRKWCSFIFLVKEENQFESIKIIVFEIDCTYTVCPRVHILMYMRICSMSYSDIHIRYIRHIRITSSLRISLQISPPRYNNV